MTNRVRERRDELGWTQMQLAIKTRTTPPHISKIENGHLPSLSSAQKLARALDVTVDYLFPIKPADVDDPDDALECAMHGSQAVLGVGR